MSLAGRLRNLSCVLFMAETALATEYISLAAEYDITTAFAGY
jgi:hypothetical protein